jgi:carbonic anhydrase/acetyltransferase-like protein (isoleucine patch superfamily)
MPVHPYNGVWPKIHDSAWIAPGAQVIGDVEVGPESSIWFNCVVRGDVNVIRIGARTNIQDGSIIHVNSGTHPTHIGDDVLVGHMALLHGCTLESRAFVGLGAIVMDGAVVQGDAMLAAGSLLAPNKRLPSGELWTGRPARFTRTLGAEEIAFNRTGAPHYVEVARRYRDLKISG